MYGLLTITIMFFLLLAMDLSSDVKGAQITCPSHCSICTIGSTVCITDPTEPFPLNLDPNTTGLDITYKGEDTFTLTEKNKN